MVLRIENSYFQSTNEIVVLQKVEDLFARFSVAAFVKGTGY